jgi:hypothetical protein
MIGMDGMGYTLRKNVFRSLDFLLLLFHCDLVVRYRVTTLLCYGFMLLVRVFFFERCTYGAAKGNLWTGVG